ncbi:MAG: molecular chaperone HtpG [Gammaproteobacteria bacterium]|nr:molecular chaperone HtpG [Gammaproteobacteria bacterium]
MTIVKTKEKHHFQAEIKQLLRLMVNSLYSNKEIFLRELISNASDALDKLRFEALKQPELLQKDSELKIQITADKSNKTITVSDNGIGMSEQEVTDHLGTIAKSGTQEFLSALTGDKAKDLSLIGQFGVGFYSSFIVADTVTVKTQRAGSSDENAVEWESDGQGEFTVTSIRKSNRGTDVILHLKADEKELLDDFKLRTLIHKYSDHIRFPILMVKRDEKGKETHTYETINKATALWIRPRSEIKEEEYKEFYKHVAHDFEDPLLWTHNKVEGKLEYTTLLYIPKRAPFGLWLRDHKHGLKLYVQRVFILDEVEQFLPFYLRFVRGVVDTNDLPLNISREILQKSKAVETIKSAITKRVLDLLEETAQNDPKTYAEVWKEFGAVLKEGPAEDITNREKIAKLLRFSSTKDDQETPSHALTDYLSRMRFSQKNIYYVSADSFLAARNSPHLEIFRKKEIEVLLLHDRIDEWLIASLQNFDGKSFQSVAQGALDLGSVADKVDTKERAKTEEEFKDLIDRVKKVLSEDVKDVRTTERLTTSPACLVADEQGITSQMERILKAAGQPLPTGKPIFELNPHHVLVKRIKSEVNPSRFEEWIHVLFDQAVLAEGGHLKDPARFVQRINHFLQELAWVK